MERIQISLLVCILAACASIRLVNSTVAQEKENAAMRLGNLSVSLAVKDRALSRAFYEKLGFTACGGDATKIWLVLQNGNGRIGLFQGMFEKNILTFNSGWDSNAKPLADFDDVRDLQRELMARGLEPSPEAEEASGGPAYLMLHDPDGNPILIDRHVPRPGK